MNGGIAPFLLIAGAIALLLGRLSLRSGIVGGIAFVAAAVIGFILHVPLALGIVFTGLFLSLILVAISVYLPLHRWQPVVIPIAVNCGLWVGTCAALTSTFDRLALGLLPTLLAIPVHWLIKRNFAILIKVVASWMIAIASLALFVSLMPTPGYKPDHME